MIYRKKSKILAFLLIIGIQLLIYINNTDKSNLKFFIWNSQEIKLGKLINISFFSGFLISTFMNNLIITKYKKTSINDEENTFEENDGIKDEYDTETRFEMPPQRDVRETQPTISVNYRVVKNSNIEYEDLDGKYQNNNHPKDDWVNNESDW